MTVREWFVGHVYADHNASRAVRRALAETLSAMPHEAIGRTFLLGELVVLLWLGFRLWQKAVEAAWYQRRTHEQQQPVFVEALAAEIVSTGLQPNDAASSVQ